MKLIWSTFISASSSLSFSSFPCRWAHPFPFLSNTFICEFIQLCAALVSRRRSAICLPERSDIIRHSQWDYSERRGRKGNGDQHHKAQERERERERVGQRQENRHARKEEEILSLDFLSTRKRARNWVLSLSFSVRI